MAGVAPGAAIVGWVVDHHGASASYWVPSVAGFTGAAIAFTTAAVSSSHGAVPADRQAVEI
jgi:hypothetical protein